MELYYYSWRCYFIVVFGTCFHFFLYKGEQKPEYSDSWILDNNYPSVGIEQG